MIFSVNAFSLGSRLKKYTFSPDITSSGFPHAMAKKLELAQLELAKGDCQIPGDEQTSPELNELCTDEVQIDLQTHNFEGVKIESPSPFAHVAGGSSLSLGQQSSSAFEAIVSDSTKKDDYLNRRKSGVSEELQMLGLLRGVQFSVLVMNLGSIWRTGQTLAGGASDETFSWSRAMQSGSKFFAFLSHSWRGNGRCKAITLQHTQISNWRKLVPVTGIVLVIVIVAGLALSIARSAHECTLNDTSLTDLCFPCEDHTLEEGQRCRHSDQNRPYQTSLFLQRNICLVILVFMILFGLSGSHLLPCFRRSSDMYFLDKCCIDQKDKEKMMMGVSRFGEFLQASDRMFVLYDRTYLERMWCIFELAWFMRLNKGSFTALEVRHILLTPVSYAILLCVCLPMWLVSYVTTLVAFPRAVKLVVNSVLLLFTLVFLGGFLLYWHKERQRMSAQLSTFKVQDAKCFSAEDRASILNFIETIWTPDRVSFPVVVSPSCDLHETPQGISTGIEVFNAFVQKELRNTLLRRTFPWMKTIFRLTAPSLMFSIWVVMIVLIPPRIGVALS